MSAAPLLVVDAANVVGSVPDGWWRDRAGATARLRDKLTAVGGQGLPDLPAPVEVVLVVEGRARDIEETQGLPPNYPLIADPDRRVAELYGMIHPKADNTLTVRSVFIIGPDKKVKLTLTYPASTGRNFDEILRVLDSLQLTAQHSVATPVNWRDGEDVIVVPSLSDEQARAKFPKGFRAVKPYLRITPQPNK